MGEVSSLFIRPDGTKLQYYMEVLAVERVNHLSSQPSTLDARIVTDIRSTMGHRDISHRSHQDRGGLRQRERATAEAQAVSRRWDRVGRPVSDSLHFALLTSWALLSQIVSRTPRCLLI